MTTDPGPDTPTQPALNAKKTYRSRIGFVADSPNFPSEWNSVIEKVKIADELGFDSVWLGKSWGYELFTSMTDLVREMKHIKVGAGIANIYSRTPALIAMSAATLDERSGGRILLGLGPSGANVIEHWHGVRFEKPLKRTREYVEILRMIFREEKLVYHGEYFNLDRGFKLRFKPLRPDIPIYIAAMGPKNLVQSGEIADGVLPVYWPGNKWGEMRALLGEGERVAGRAAHSTMIAPYITSVLLPENVSEEQRKTVRLRAAAPLAYYIARMGAYYADMLTRNGFGEDVEAVKEANKRGGTQAAAAAVSDRMLDATSIIGTPKEFVVKLEAWAEAGVDEPLLSMPGGLVDEAASQLSSLMDALKQD